MDRGDMGTKGSGGTCGLCGGLTYLIERVEDRAQARPCDCSKKCMVCEGRGFVLAEKESTFSKKVGSRKYEVMMGCSCTKRTERIAIYNAVGLPGVVAHATFDNFRPGTDDLSKAKGIAEHFAHHYTKGAVNTGFILSGPVGTGKTHLLAATLSHLALEYGVRARYVEISLLYATIRRGFQEGKSGGEIIGPLSEVEVLAIDELGKGRGSPFELETLDELIARRYNASRTTLFATNLSLQQAEKASARAPQDYRTTPDPKTILRDSELLVERTNERIYSRLFEMCHFVEIPRSTADKRKENPNSGSQRLSPFNKTRQYHR